MVKKSGPVQSSPLRVCDLVRDERGAGCAGAKLGGQRGKTLRKLECSYQHGRGVYVRTQAEGWMVLGRFVAKLKMRFSTCDSPILCKAICTIFKNKMKAAGGKSTKASEDRLDLYRPTQTQAARQASHGRPCSVSARSSAWRVTLRRAVLGHLNLASSSSWTCARVPKQHTHVKRQS